MENEYLLELRQHHKINSKATSIISSLGDVMLIEDDSQRRYRWKMGIIVELVEGSDGVVRGAKLRTTKPEGYATTLARSLQPLFPLEINNRDQDEDEDTEDVEVNTTDEGKIAEDKTTTTDAGKKKAVLLWYFN